MLWYARFDIMRRQANPQVLKVSIMDNTGTQTLSDDSRVAPDGVILLYLVILPRVAPHFSATYGEIAGHDRWYWTYLSNFSLALFTPNQRGVLNSTWSLGIEEQFYLIWPTVVFFFNRQTLQKVC